MISPHQIVRGAASLVVERSAATLRRPECVHDDPGADPPPPLLRALGGGQQEGVHRRQQAAGRQAGAAYLTYGKGNVGKLHFQFP